MMVMFSDARGKSFRSIYLMFKDLSYKWEVSIAATLVVNPHRRFNFGKKEAATKDLI